MTISTYNPANSLAFMGLSTDTKPTNVASGSRFLETDTGNVFMFYNTGSWTQVATIPSSGWTETGIAIAL
jgi:hypothetical protein